MKYMIKMVGMMLAVVLMFGNGTDGKEQSSIQKALQNTVQDTIEKAGNKLANEFIDMFDVYIDQINFNL